MSRATSSGGAAVARRGDSDAAFGKHAAEHCAEGPEQTEAISATATKTLSVRSPLLATPIAVPLPAAITAAAVRSAVKDAVGHDGFELLVHSGGAKLSLTEREPEAVAALEQAAAPQCTLLPKLGAGREVLNRAQKFGVEDLEGLKRALAGMPEGGQVVVQMATADGSAPTTLPIDPKQLLAMLASGPAAAAVAATGGPAVPTAHGEDAQQRLVGPTQTKLTPAELRAHQQRQHDEMWAHGQQKARRQGENRRMERTLDALRDKRAAKERRRQRRKQAKAAKHAQAAPDAAAAPPPTKPSAAVPMQPPRQPQRKQARVASRSNESTGMFGFKKGFLLG